MIDMSEKNPSEITKGDYIFYLPLTLSLKG